MEKYLVDHKMLYLFEPLAELESALPHYKCGTSPYMFKRLIEDRIGIEPMLN